jgi:uncharacterized protein (DUF1810 family)
MRDTGAMDDPFNLQRFVDAQAPVYERVLEELRAGRKTSHWIWFIFPQAKGLGRSPRSEFYGIGSLDEARAYLAHPILGPRLGECVDLVMSHEGVPLEEILGGVDAMKFLSCIELFSDACGIDWLRR